MATMPTVGTAGGNKDVSITIGTAGGNRAVTEGWIGTAGGNKQFLSSSDTPSMTAGNDGADIVGYDPGFFGSMTPTTNKDGHTYSYLIDDNGVGFEQAAFYLAAGSDPGQSYFTSITANGQTRLAASATYAYSGGLARWSWAGAGNLFGFVNASVYPVTINY